MFITIKGNSVINTDNIVSCEPNSGVVLITMTNDKRFQMSETDFNRDILPQIIKPRKATS